MYFLTNEKTGDWIGLFSEIEVTPEGIWTWTGLHADASYEPLVPGLRVSFFDHNICRVDARVTKVNRVTFKAIDDAGTVHTVRVDR